MEFRIPPLSKEQKGLALIIASLILFLYVTNILTMGLQTVLLLAAIVMFLYGCMLLDAYNKVMSFFNSKKKH